MTKTPSIITAIIEGLQEKKGRDIVALDLQDIEGAPAPYFVICQGTSTTHTAAVADAAIEYVRKKEGRKPYAEEGFKNSEWIVIDFGEAIVHVFMPETREHYNLEELWSDGKEIFRLREP